MADILERMCVEFSQETIRQALAKEREMRSQVGFYGAIFAESTERTEHTTVFIAQGLRTYILNLEMIKGISITEKTLGWGGPQIGLCQSYELNLRYQELQL